jgi:hypothetical protein
LQWTTIIILAMVVDRNNLFVVSKYLVLTLFFEKLKNV